jgi:hypothetical protein
MRDRRAQGEANTAVALSRAFDLQRGYLQQLYSADLYGRIEFFI